MRALDLPKKVKNLNLSDLIKNIIKKYENHNITSEINESITMHGRKNLITRCINNLIENSIKYAKKVHIQLKKTNNNNIIIIDDDGPGIDENEYDNVFKPFYKNR